jgi:hypothetical protein
VNLTSDILSVGSGSGSLFSLNWTEPNRGNPTQGTTSRYIFFLFANPTQYLRGG